MTNPVDVLSWREWNVTTPGKYVNRICKNENPTIKCLHEQSWWIKFKEDDLTNKLNHILCSHPFQILKMLMKSFLPGYKNPCFRSSSQTGMAVKCLPYFYLVGAPKCGTTDVWYNLLRHPQVMHVRKEPHYWKAKVKSCKYVILGAPKCGTTGVWFNLLRHPQVIPFRK